MVRRGRWRRAGMDRAVEDEEEREADRGGDDGWE